MRDWPGDRRGGHPPPRIRTAVPAVAYPLPVRYKHALPEPTPASPRAPATPTLPLAILAALRRLRPVDVGFMKALHEKVNIVPLIAKADCLVPGEIRKLKERVSLLWRWGLGQVSGPETTGCAESGCQRGQPWVPGQPQI